MPLDVMHSFFTLTYFVKLFTNFTEAKPDFSVNRMITRIIQYNSMIHEYHYMNNYWIMESK